MATVTFDTMAFVDMLTLSGFDEKQAKGLANAIKEVAKDEHLTTKEESKADLSIIRSDIEITRRELKTDILESSLTIKNDMMSMKADMKVMMFLMAGMFAGVGAILMKMLFPH